MIKFLQYLVVLLFVGLCGCTVHFKATEIELDSKPVTPVLTESNHTYELEKIAFFK